MKYSKPFYLYFEDHNSEIVPQFIDMFVLFVFPGRWPSAHFEVLPRVNYEILSLSKMLFFYIPNHVTDFLPINLKSDNVPPAVYFKYQFFSFLLSLSKLFWDVLPPLCHSNSQWVKVFLVMVKCQDLNIYKWDLQVIALCCCIHTLHSILTLKELGLYILSTVLVEFCYYINSLLLGELTFTFGFNSYTAIHTLIRFVMG